MQSIKCRERFLMKNENFLLTSLQVLIKCSSISFDKSVSSNVAIRLHKNPKKIKNFMSNETNLRQTYEVHVYELNLLENVEFHEEFHQLFL